MKTFACGQVVEDCPAVFAGPEFENLLRQVAEHARTVHGLHQVPPEVVVLVRQAAEGPLEVASRSAPPGADVGGELGSDSDVGGDAR